jgi:competence CoiA-like predicted nuclease
LKYAVSLLGNERLTPIKGVAAVCPMCKTPVVPKIGEIYVPHWSHKSIQDCDTWRESETEWHRNWKEEFPNENQEIIIGKHIADVKLENGLVIEFQNSSISSEEIKERENHYGNMVWIVNGNDFFYRFGLRFKKTYYSFRWKNPRKSWCFASKPVFIDFGEDIFLIKKIYKNTPCGGWGIIIPRDVFIRRLNK